MKPSRPFLYAFIISVFTLGALMIGCGGGGTSTGGGSTSGSGSAGGGSTGGTSSQAVTRFNGNYGGNVTLSCPDVSTVSITLSLSISNGVISVSYPQPGGGAVDGNGNASMQVNNPSDTRGASILSGTFLINSTGVASGGGTWEERHATYTCPGTWTVRR
jgi:hypothetical protein